MRNLRRMPFVKMFMPKRKTNGAIWASLASIGIGAAVLTMTKGKWFSNTLPLKDSVKKFASPIKDSVKNIVPKMNINNMDTAALTEFSQELLSSALNNKNKR
ncbi:hypothetical protein RCG24_04050 [Neobacillus sp. OS1-32]|jgi:hypothetical protein|uniref:YtxH domain-containing protein n=1 Tax=Neobacillus paridis TaxID=2803862 RepID=A0ABS1TQ61_9BACI|nr:MULTISPECIES: hypothetical protein [Neobacillus]MBL4953422.1 hypothetical protein [Neobacillus paridis]WML31073.1 hypothetical protein RCG24_04050 [Neobacillus sp. OS1-32]